MTDDPAEEWGLEWTRDGQGLSFVSSDQVSHLLVFFAIPPCYQIVRVGVEALLEGPGK